MKKPVLLILLLGIAACQPKMKQAALPEGTTACPEARPQICTMIYDPVCATHQDGSQTTEASNCSACAKPEIMTYRLGACE